MVLGLLLLASVSLAETPNSENAGIDSAFKGPGSIVDRSPQHRSQMLSIFVGIPAWYGYYGGPGFGFPLSVGGRFYQPIAHNGFIHDVNDSVGIEFGADFISIFSSSYGGLIALPVEGMWQFHLTKDFSAYAKLGIAFEIGFGSGYRFGGYSTAAYFTANAIAGVGIMYKVSDVLVLRAEAGYPGIKVGLGFNLL